MSLIDELKSIDIVAFLTSRGHPIKKESNTKVWFCAPNRAEQEPSFCVFKASNKWIDYGSNEKGGDILDLVCLLNSCDVKTAMETLKNDGFVVSFEPIEISDEPLINVSVVHDRLIAPELIMYMRSRGIPERIYSKHVKEVHYFFTQNPEKTYFGVGWANDESGWETRNKFQKYCIAPKAITTVNDDGGTLNLWEGWINYLSALVYFGVERFEGTTIVLNGLGMLYRILPTLNQYQKVNCFLDLGNGGNKSTDLIRSIVGAERCYDHRYLFLPEMDFNDLLVSQQEAAKQK